MTSHHLRLLAKKWARLIHIYISMLGLVLIVFFALTGFLLNHPDAFGLGKISTRHQEGELSADLLRPPVNQARIIERLRTEFGLRGQLASFEEDRGEVRVGFKGPGRTIDAVIRLKDGHCTVISQSRGPLGRLGELHRGTDAGGGWRLLLDAAALLTLAVAFTGVVLWLIVPRWRRWGVAALVLSSGVGAVVYWLLVP